MKYIKTYESNIIALGEYVICDDDHKDELEYDIINFLSNNIGRICDYDKCYDFVVEYENVPENIQGFFNYKYPNCRPMYYSEIIYHSKNKKDLEIILTANKYNL